MAFFDRELACYLLQEPISAAVLTSRIRSRTVTPLVADDHHDHIPDDFMDGEDIY